MKRCFLHPLNSKRCCANICKRLIAKRVQAPEVFASESTVVCCFLSAAYVETGKLTVAISEIDVVEAHEVVNLMLEFDKRRFAELLSSAPVKVTLLESASPSPYVQSLLDTYEKEGRVYSLLPEDSFAPSSAAFIFLMRQLCTVTNMNLTFYCACVF